MSIPDEFMFGNHSLLENINRRPRSYSDSIVLSALRFEESVATRSSIKNRNYNYPHRKSIDEINERRYLIAKREIKKWSRKEGRLNKLLSSMDDNF